MPQPFNDLPQHQLPPGIEHLRGTVEANTGFDFSHRVTSLKTREFLVGTIRTSTIVLLCLGDLCVNVVLDLCVFCVCFLVAVRVRFVLDLCVCVPERCSTNADVTTAASRPLNNFEIPLARDVYLWVHS